VFIKVKRPGKPFRTQGILLGCFVYYSGLRLFELENAVLQPGKHLCEIQEAGSKPDLLFV